MLHWKVNDFAAPKFGYFMIFLRFLISYIYISLANTVLSQSTFGFSWLNPSIHPKPGRICRSPTRRARCLPWRPCRSYWGHSDTARWNGKGPDFSGGDWLPSIWHFPINIGLLIIPIDSYFAEGWTNHQPVLICEFAIWCFAFWSGVRSLSFSVSMRSICVCFLMVFVWQKAAVGISRALKLPWSWRVPPFLSIFATSPVLQLLQHKMLLLGRQMDERMSPRISWMEDFSSSPIFPDVFLYLCIILYVNSSCFEFWFLPGSSRTTCHRTGACGIFHRAKLDVDSPSDMMIVPQISRSMAIMVAGIHHSILNLFIIFLNHLEVIHSPSIAIIFLYPALFLDSGIDFFECQSFSPAAIIRSWSSW